MNWILPASTVGLGIVCIALAVLYILAQRKARKWRDGYHDLMRENKQLEQQRNEARKQRDELNRENESLHTANKRIVTEQLELHKQNTKLREDLQEAKAKIKALDMQTVEIEEVKPEIEQAARYQTVLDTGKPEPKRPPRKPKATQN